MSAAILNLRWDDLVNGQVPAVASKNPGLFCRIRVQAQAHRCPYCDSIVYSRRHSRCGVCAQVLPEECLFTVSEAEKVEREARKAKREEKRAAASAAATAALSASPSP